MVDLTVLQKSLFYHKDYPLFAKYGGVANIMAHELSHAFEDVYVYELLWKDNENAMNKYKQYTNCLINQYDQFDVSKYDSIENSFVNGNLTYVENQAAEWGQVISYNVFEKELTKQFDNEEISQNFRLPGLNLTMDQLYFVTKGAIGCQTVRPGYYDKHRNSLTHPPEPARINGVFGNFEQFADVFNCPQDSFMNLDTRCTFF